LKTVAFRPSIKLDPFNRILVFILLFAVLATSDDHNIKFKA
jgi:hypothetical protein